MEENKIQEVEQAIETVVSTQKSLSEVALKSSAIVAGFTLVAYISYRAVKYIKENRTMDYFKNGKIHIVDGKVLDNVKVAERDFTDTETNNH